MKKNFLILLSLIAVFSVLFTFAAFADTEAVADDTAAVSDSVAADDTAADTEAAADDTAADTEADTEAVVTDEHGHAADAHNTTGTVVSAPTATWSNLGTSGIIGIVVAAVILVAVIVAIIVLAPKKSGTKK